MAAHAGDSLMCAEQRKRRIVVIECRRLPCRCRMAGQTVMREISRDMVWISHLLKIILMA